jgi:hypothetical protein
MLAHIHLRGNGATLCGSESRHRVEEMTEAGTKAVRSSQGYVILLNKTQGIWWLEVTAMRVPLIGGVPYLGPPLAPSVELSWV